MQAQAQYEHAPLPAKRPAAAELFIRYPIYPLAGLLSIVFATPLAISLMPNDVSPRGALVIPAVVMTLGIMLAPCVAALKNPQTLLRAEHLLVLSPIFWLLLDMLQGAYALQGVSRESVEGSFWAIGIFVFAIWLAALTKPWQLPSGVLQSASHVVTPQSLFWIILLMFALGILKFAVPTNFNPATMGYYLLQSRWNTPWNRGQLGGWDAFLDHTAYFGYLLPTLTVLLIKRTKISDIRVIVSTLLALIMTAFLAQGGGRRILGVVFGAAIVCWVLEQKKIKASHVIAVLFSTAALLLVMQLMLEYRATGVRVVVEGKNQEFGFDHFHVDDNFYRLSQVIEYVPEVYPHVYEKQLIYILVRPIPRVLWEGKPVDAGFDLAKVVGIKGTSLSSSVLGEFYLSLGYLGILLGGLFYGKVAGMFSVLLVRRDESSAAVLVYGLATMMMFAGVRSLQELVLMSYAVLAWVGVSYLINSRRSVTARRERTR